MRVSALSKEEIYCSRATSLINQGGYDAMCELREITLDVFNSQNSLNPDLEEEILAFSEVVIAIRTNPNYTSHAKGVVVEDRIKKIFDKMPDSRL